MVNANTRFPALIVVFGGGLAYWVMSNRDTTPVGLTITKSVENSQPIGSNGDDEYSMGLVEGTFRESEATLPVSSEGETDLYLSWARMVKLLMRKSWTNPNPNRWNCLDWH